MVEREFQAMKAMRLAGIAVPEVLTLCEDDNVLGTPFYTMDYVQGRLLKDPALPQADKAQRRDIYFAALE